MVIKFRSECSDFARLVKLSGNSAAIRAVLKTTDWSADMNTILLDLGKAIKEGKPLPGETELEARIRKTANNIRKFYIKLAAAAEEAGVEATEGGHWVSEDNFVHSGGYGWKYNGEYSTASFSSVEEALCDAAFKFDLGADIDQEDGQ